MNNFNQWFKQNYAGNEGKTLPYTDQNGTKRDILMKLAQPAQSPAQQPAQPQIPEGTELFDYKAANADLAQKQQADMQAAKDAKLNVAPEKKVDSKVMSAAEDVGSALAGPTKNIDMGSYSTFQPEDTMGNLKQQVLKNMMMRG